MNKKKKNKKSTNRPLLVILTVICISLMLLTAAEVIHVEPLHQMAEAVIVPMQNGINKVGTWLTDKQTGFQDVQELAAENEELKKQVAALKEENTILTENTNDLNTLRKLYSLDNDYSEYEKIGADVIAKTQGNWYNTFTINKGSDDGIKVNMNVISDGGLTGIVTEVGDNWANVRSIIDDDSNISAMSLTESESCIISGDQTLLEQGKLRLSQLSTDATVTEGERIVTSNISDKYLPGILIGYVDSIEDDSNHLTKNGYIIPAVDFKNISHVLVIKQLKQTGGTE